MNKQIIRPTENNYIDFNRYKKARYEIRIDNKVVYFFVTTAKSQEESIEILSEKARSCFAGFTRGFKIYKIVAGEEELLFKEKRFT